jgi:hypothetical protein
LQSTLSALLLITSTVILASTVVSLTVAVFSQSMEQPIIPTAGNMDAFQERLQSQAAALLNQTLTQSVNQTWLQPQPP